MRTKPSQTYFSKLTLFLILPAILFTACSAEELTRAKAEALIKESDEFKNPFSVSLLTPTENDPFFLDKAGESEKVEEAQARNLARFFDFYPEIAVVNHLGLVTIEQKLVREEKAVGFQVPAQWFFSVKVRANEKGKELWKEYGLPAADNLIPLARKEISSIKGITSLAENQRIAEFTWKWIPNKTGLAFQENTEGFRALPDELKRGLLGQTRADKQRQTKEWSATEQTGKAFYLKYDDGWRVMRIVNF
jgi:hypothetical protein